MHDDFVANLRLLCSYYPSIAEVCRRLDINRAQFNRYLSGRYRPRHAAMRRLCAFFGVEEHELYLPHENFVSLVQAGRLPTESSRQGGVEWPDALLQRGREGMARYLGRYFEYYHSMAQPGHIIRTLVCLEARESGIVYQRTERLQGANQIRPCHNRYTGVAVKLADRIFLTDYETLNGYEVTHTILFPTFQSQVTRLTGLRLGVADNSERMPCCVRVLFERIDEQVGLRRALSQCGLLALDDPSLDAALLAAVRNDVASGEPHFRARHQGEFHPVLESS
ncbi:helix-turn-helix domain-containing protein [Billgrantia ethanolica]|uniref:Helix-turn-helix transcriptional regulator n=1 Tax=Billgrantia ethanolica TaxID=2733486 RepID=A0ABS9A928_9GAMM|nr:helix-turn-helix transcriptional regulator [Halomonas ethanolica]MCE8004545.1 helix-turn-helix transcriptional regulator [Halomonas ethanolica]